jgi:hypothetical protein
MNNHFPSSDRRNVQLATTVDVAVGMMRSNHRADIAQFLEKSGATFPVIVRVLSSIERRKIVCFSLEEIPLYWG